MSNGLPISFVIDSRGHNRQIVIFEAEISIDYARLVADPFSPERRAQYEECVRGIDRDLKSANKMQCFKCGEDARESYFFVKKAVPKGEGDAVLRVPIVVSLSVGRSEASLLLLMCLLLGNRDGLYVAYQVHVEGPQKPEVRTSISRLRGRRNTRPLRRFQQS